MRKSQSLLKLNKTSNFCNLLFKNKLKKSKLKFKFNNQSNQRNNKVSKENQDQPA